MGKRTTDYVTEGFFGTLVLKDWLEMPDGNSYKGIVGEISIVRDVDLVGFEAHGNESNWVAIVDGRTTRLVVLGCQVRGALTHDPDLEITSQSYWRVR